MNLQALMFKQNISALHLLREYQSGMILLNCVRGMADGSAQEMCVGTQ